MTLVRLGTYGSWTEANIVKAKLEAFEIDAIVDADPAASGLPNLEVSQGVRVMVRESDLAEAYEVLERMLPSGEGP